MKQHITVEQMKEINDKELAKYMGLHFTHLLEEVCYYGAEKPFGRDKLKEMSEMITIGKMIEIIYDKVEYFCLEGNDLSIYVTNEGDYVDFESDYDFKYNSMCDTLWEAVKYLLNNK